MALALVMQTCQGIKEDVDSMAKNADKIKKRVDDMQVAIQPLLLDKEVRDMVEKDRKIEKRESKLVILAFFSAIGSAVISGAVLAVLFAAG